MSVLERPINTPAAWSERAQLAPTSWEASGWTEAGQVERFHAVRWRLGVVPGETVLDFGCGTGAFADLIPSSVDYVGFDTAPGMIARARAERPSRRFTLAEPGRADAVACIGPFNLADRWQKAYTWETLRRLWDKTGRVLVASLYAGTDERCLIYTEDEVARFAASESFYHQVSRWRENDLTLTLSRKAIA